MQVKISTPIKIKEVEKEKSKTKPFDWIKKNL